MVNTDLVPQRYEQLLQTQNSKSVIPDFNDELRCPFF